MITNLTPREDKTIIRALNTCIETCLDGEKGFAIAAADVRSPRLKETFLSASRERASFVLELQKLVAALGRLPENEGTTRGALHRSWIATMRVAIGRNDALYVEECIRGERAALRDYEVALRRAHIETLPPHIATTLRKQYLAIKTSLTELLQIASVERATKYEVRVMEAPAQHALTVRTRTTRANLPALMQSTFDRIARDVYEVGVPFAMYHDAFRPEDMDVEIGVVVPPDVHVADDGLTRRQLPAQTIAYVLHVGPYETLGAAYDALDVWMRQNGRTQIGPARESYLIGPEDTTRSEDYRTEIELPFA